ncbi:hypothetical protein V6259_18615 [Marinomonas sp. TI.3.20]|uniref:hypothetical protein n=1 Tax=Marinomonas sp. TI.3.20 TaxID=3121296 RepID=UPI00311F31F3
MKKYLLKQFYRVIHLSDTSEITSLLSCSGQIPAWNKRKHLVDSHQNLNWPEILQSLFGQRNVFDEKTALNKDVLDLHKLLVKESVSVESINVRHLAGFSRGSVTSTKSTLVEIGSDVSRLYEGILKKKVTKQKQLEFLLDDPAYYMGPIKWTEWHNKYDQTGGTGGGAHRTSSLVFLLNYFDMDLFVDVQVHRFYADLSALEFCQKQYSFYVFNPNDRNRVRLFHKDNDFIKECGGVILGTHSIDNESLSLIVIDRAHCKSWLLENIFKRACDYGQAIKLLDYLKDLAANATRHNEVALRSM